MTNFWKSLKKPFTVLAPMEDVTDTVFRQIVAKYSKPDVFFTEFVSVDGLLSEGFEKVSTRLQFSKTEKPLIAQIWGNNPEKFYQTALMISKMGFDGIDINMGCPDKNVVKKGSGGALILTPNLAKEIVIATKKGAGGLPVSVKTRIGMRSIATEEWIGFLLSLDLDALTIHGRTVKEKSKVLAHWDEIGAAVKLRDKISPKTLIIGNGDVMSYKQAQEYAKKYGVDGIMIGRGVFNNLWVFNPKIREEDISPEMRIEALITHINLFEKTWGINKNYDILKKFFKAYISGFDGSKTLRTKLMDTKTPAEALNILSPKKP
ncbi:MAG: tRNA-dihydrouridine synthase [Candidatus Daviesbacteria bacterium]|nr:tRNA-dihydrouridine synthase [Candidatus Daviesbacteria bacterium]